jgi:hypothetical protein
MFRGRFCQSSRPGFSYPKTKKTALAGGPLHVKMVCDKAGHDAPGGRKPGAWVNGASGDGPLPGSPPFKHTPHREQSPVTQSNTINHSRPLQ